MSLDLETLLKSATEEQKAEALRALKGQIVHWFNALLDDEMNTHAIDERIVEFYGCRNSTHQTFLENRGTSSDGGSQRAEDDHIIKEILERRE